MKPFGVIKVAVIVEQVVVAAVETVWGLRRV